MKPWMIGLVAVAAVAALGRSRRTLGSIRHMFNRNTEAGMTDEDIQRFVNEGGAPLGAGAE